MNKFNFRLAILFLVICFWTPLSSQTPTASFATWKDNKKAAYSIIHDDYSDYVTGIFQYADPIATARGIKLCFGAITSACGPLEWDNAKTMMSHGHECINHSHNHLCGGTAGQCSGLSTYGPANFATELDFSTQLIEINTGVRPRFFIHPYDAPSGAIINYLTSIGYLGSRAGTQLTTNPSTFTDFMHLNFYVYDGTAAALASLNTAVNTAISSGGYALREFHGIDDGSWSAMTVANYTSHLDYVKTKMDDGSIWSATPTEAITYKMQRDAFQPVVAYTAATGIINVTFNTLKTIDPSVLRTPVTVNVNLNGIAGTYNVLQNNSNVISTRVGNIISFNVYPNQGAVTLKCTDCAPPQPLNIFNLTATPQTNAALLNWSNPLSNFDEVMIVAKPISGFTTLPTGTTYASDANFTGAGTAFEGGKVIYREAGTNVTVTNLIGGTTYYFRAYTRLGNIWSSGVEVNVIPTILVIPQPLSIFNLTATPQTNAALLNWTNPTSNFDEVMIVAKPTAGFTTIPTGTTYTADANFTGASTAFEGGKVIYRGAGTGVTVTNLIGGTTYYFRAYTRLGNIWSSGVEVNVIPTILVIPQPLSIFNLTATPQTNAALLNWTNPVSNFDEVMIVAKPKSGFTTIPAGTIYAADANFTGAGTAFEGGKVVYRGAGTNVTVTNLIGGTTYYFRAYTRLGNIWSSGVEVNAVPNSVIIPPVCGPDGKIIREYWNNINYLVNPSITYLTIDSRYPNNPTSRDTLTEFRSSNRGDRYGERAKGYIIPKESGLFTFYVTGDDNVDFYLSTTESASNKRRICRISGLTGETEFSKYSSQKSVAINLVAGQYYYFELQHVQGIATNHFSVYWQTPSNSTITLIDKAFFSSKTCTATPLQAATAQYFAFDGRLDGDKAVLNWVSKSVNETDYFILEKADEKTGEFKQLDIINTFDKNQALQAFSYADANLIDGDNFYRLKTVFQNGASVKGNSLEQYSEIVKVRYDRPNLYDVFPNPTIDYFSIDLSPANGKAVDIKIITLLGKVIKQERVETPSVFHRFELGDIPSGQYFIQIQPQGKRLVMRKLMVIK